MTGRATFGDFAASASHHLRRVHWAIELSAVDERADAADVVTDLRRAVHVIARYAEDVSGALDAEYMAGDRTLGVWVRAAAKAREVLAAVGADLSTAPRESTGGDRPLRGSGELRAATRSMTLGRDLLHTHGRAPGGGITAGGSEWTPVISSAPVACAVLHELGGWSRQITGYAYRMSATPSCPAAQRRTLSAAGKTLSQISWAIGEAQERHPVRRSQLKLLHAVPLNAVPASSLPANGDSVANLSAGVVSTAERLRTAARGTSAPAAWSRQHTRETLRQTAGCCAISASNVQVLLHTLAERNEVPCAPVSAAIAEAAQAADRARAAWLAVTDEWNSITTDTRGTMGPAGTEAAALALWSGRLAYADPDWTPALGPLHMPRPAGELAPDPDQLRGAVDAAHHVADTLAQVAAADREHVRIAAIAGRLLVPTRSLPDGYDVAYRFAPAPPSNSAPLLDSYNRALRASDEATAAMAKVAADVQADSRLITSARAAAQRDPGAWSGMSVHEASSELGSGQKAAVRSLARRPQMQPALPGPVERLLIELNVTSKPDLEQAAAIDKAADQLIVRAATTAKPLQPDRHLGHSVGSAEPANHASAANGGGPARLRSHRQSVRQLEVEAGG